MSHSYENRSLSELRQHYDVESRLARRLLAAQASERRQLYSSVYTELLQSVPLHPHHTRKADPAQSKQEIDDKMRFLGRFLTPTVTFLEVGAGNCQLALRVARLARKVFALEISEEVVKNVMPSENLEIVLSDGCTVPVPDGSIDLAYSYQVMEHIHPDDAAEQLRNVWKALRRGGRYICITPNRVSGPHDISQYFDVVSSGFHLREYSWAELANLLRAVGFEKVDSYVGFRKKYMKLPLRFLMFVEGVVALMPASMRRSFANKRPMRNLLFITAVGVK